MIAPTAWITDIRPVSGVWSVTALCPDGYTVRHGAGPVTADPRLLLGTRGSHCDGRPLTRRDPGCSHGSSYRLVPSPDLVIPTAEDPA